MMTMSLTLKRNPNSVHPAPRPYAHQGYAVRQGQQVGHYVDMLRDDGASSHGPGILGTCHIDDFDGFLDAATYHKLVTTELPVYVTCTIED